MSTYKMIDGSIGLYENQKNPKPYLHDITKCIDVKNATFEDYFSNIETLDATSSIPWREGVIINEKWEKTPILFIMISKKKWGKSNYTMSARTMVEFTHFRLITKL
jgi:hypothetical protein